MSLKFTLAALLTIAFESLCFSEPVKFVSISKWEDKLVLNGPFQAGLNLALLPSTNGPICYGITGSSEEVVGAENQNVITHILFKKNCSPEENYFLGAFSNSINEYKYLSLVEKKSTFPIPNKVVATAQTESQKDVGCLTQTLGDRAPKVHTLKYGKEELMFLTYFIRNLNQPPGPTLILRGAEVFPLTSPCSFDKIDPFVFNGSLFIHSGFSGCECGVAFEQVFQIATDGPKAVYNYNHSD